MRVTFAGVLCPGESHVEDTAESTDVTQRWQCNVCYAWNECRSSMQQSAAPQHPLCRVCARPQHPPWLYLSKHNFQVHAHTQRTASQTRFVYTL